MHWAISGCRKWQLQIIQFSNVTFGRIVGEEHQQRREDPRFEASVYEPGILRLRQAQDNGYLVAP